MGIKLFVAKVWRQKEIQLMVIPGIIFMIIFFYVPMYGVVIAFRDFRIGDSFLEFGKEANWVGLKYFTMFIGDPAFIQIMRNTFVISILRLVITFPAPIILAILLNEIRSKRFIKTIQSISYLPHFVSWVIVGGLVAQLLSGQGAVNDLLMSIGLIDAPILFQGESKYFWSILIISDLWKEVGWNSIIFLAAISAINPELYQVASTDGANRWQRIRYITLPGIQSTTAIVLLFTIGSLFMYGFEPIMQLTNNLTNKTLLDTAEIVDTHVLRMGIQNGHYSYATAVGLFRSIVSLVLLFSANRISKKITGSSLW